MEINNKYLDQFIVGNLNINLSTSIPEEQSFKIFSKLKSVLSNYEIRYFDHDKEEKLLRLNNGSNLSESDERIVKLDKGSNLQVLWGKNTKFEIAKEINECVVLTLIENIHLIQISDFNYEQHFEVNTVGNHYERIASIMYRENSVARFYDSLQNKVPTAKILDNDIYLLVYIQEGIIGSIRVRGKTAPREIITGKYDNDSMRFFFGVQNKIIPDNESDFLKAVLSHLEMCDQLCRDIFYPNIMSKFIIQQGA